MVAELIALRTSRSHGSDATAEGNAVGTGQAAADRGNPSAASADAAAAAGPVATRCTPNSDSRNGETVLASAVEHERVEEHRNIIGRRRPVEKVDSRVEDERRIGGNTGRV